MIHEIEMLQSIRKNAQMGWEGIEEILPHTKCEKFRKALDTQKGEYAGIVEEADRLLVKFKVEPEQLSAMAKVSSKTMTMVKTMQDNSEEHLAEMMYQGSAMGVTKIIRKIKTYSGSQEVLNLAQRLLKTEENNMDQMKKFL